MATIKSFTSVEQSRKLAAILPLETADMCYRVLPSIKEGMPAQYTSIVPDDAFFESDIPAWSLAALLSVLPQGEYEDTDLCFGGYEGDKYITEWFCSYAQQEPFILEICHADNPVDACVAIIENLHELNLL